MRFSIVVCMLLAVVPASAQTTPRAVFEQSAPSGAGNVLNVYRVPVIKSTGAAAYKDIQFQFDVSPTGELTLKPGFPVITASPALLTGKFIAGRYKIDGYFYQLSGPGVGAGGRTTWSLNRESGGCLSSAGWTSGPISGHPLGPRLTAAHITFDGYAYGVLGEVTCSGAGIPSNFNQGNLIGVAATANGLTIFNYTDSIDRANPISSASFQRCLTAAC